MKISNFNNIPFEKKLAANCFIIKDKKEEKCSIFELEEDERIDYIEKLRDNEDWLMSYFLDLALFKCHFYKKPFNFFILENDKNCLGYVETQDSENTKLVNLLEVSHSNSFNNPKRNIKYIGQDLMAFVAAKSKEGNFKKILIPQPSAGALNFYQKTCAFKKEADKKELYLDEFDFDTLINSNQKNTGKRIELIG